MPTRRWHRRNFNDPGHAHELTFSCYQRLPLLKSERTCRWLAESIDEARANHQIDVWAYVMMPEHVHLLVCPRSAEYSIAAIRKAIKEPIARRAIEFLSTHAPGWLPRLTRRRGTRTEKLFWQSGGGYDRNITTVKALLSVIEYIHLNPVRRGLADRAARWTWSSAAWFEGGTSPLQLDQIPSEWLDMSHT